MKTASRALVLVALFAALGCNGAESGGRSESLNEQVQPGSDEAALQGMWEVLSFETFRPGEGPGPDKLKAIRLTFAGDKLVIGVGPDYRTYFTFVLDAGKNPKRMTVTESNPLGGSSGGVTTAKSGSTVRAGTAPRTGTAKGSAPSPLEVSNWIYKFEGDTLILAVADPGQPAPTDFTPRGFAAASTAKGAAPSASPGGRVDIVKLKKTTAPYSGGTAGSTIRGGTSRYTTGRASTAPSTAKK